MFSLFRKKHTKSAVVIELASSSVGAALVAFPPHKPPVVVYAVRVPIVFTNTERTTLALLRTLDTAVVAIETQGLPELRRSIRVSHPDRAYIAVAHPWQNFSVTHFTEANEKPFTVTRDLLSKALIRKEPLQEDEKELKKEVSATRLNGYLVTAPFGKHANHADITVLTSVAHTDVVSLGSKSLHRIRPLERVQLAPFEHVAYEVLRAQYPHEKTFIVLLVSEHATSIVIVREGFIADSAHIDSGLQALASSRTQHTRTLSVNAPPPHANGTSVEEEKVWVSRIASAFKTFAEHGALPRMLFLVADEKAVESLKRLFDSPDIHKLWLSDEPLRVIPVVSRLLSSLITHHTHESDPTLDLVALYAGLQFDASK